MIGGFIVAGNQPKKVIVRALGPSLQERGVSGVLANPVLELRGPGGSLIATNDNWKESQQKEIQDAGLAPSSDLESAIIATLPATAHTAIVTGRNARAALGWSKFTTSTTLQPRDWRTSAPAASSKPARM